jgi:hypothetical protein
MSDEGAEPKIASAAKPKASKPSGDQNISKLFPYTNAPGALKRALDGMLDAPKPSRFTLDFLGDVLKVTGGSAAPIIPIMKRIGFLNSDGSPTELYSRFRTEGGRASAMLSGLKQGYEEAFRRREYAHRLKENEFGDLVLEATGMVKTNPTYRAIMGTWKVLSEYVGDLVDEENPMRADDQERVPEPNGDINPNTATHSDGPTIGLSYQINIVLPETTNSEVFDAIFQSLRQHLLR